MRFEIILIAAFYYCLGGEIEKWNWNCRKL